MRGNLHGGRQENRALRGAACLACGHRLDRKPEEAGESDRLSRRGDLLERPPENLRTDIDAEDGLKIGRLSRFAAAKRGELGEEFPPHGDLVRPLPEVLRPCLAPGWRLRRRDARDPRGKGLRQRGLIDQPDGEQMPEGVVRLAAQAFFMGEEFEVTRPPADAQQH